MSFFSPQTYNLTTINGNAACEFPILYYITAILYFIFGEHEFILRLLNITIIFTGFYYAIKLSYLFLQDWIYSFLVTFLIFSSGVILYYTNNFLPDISALGLSLIGWFHFVKYAKFNIQKYLIFSFVFLTLAGLLKATYMVFPIAIIGVFIIEIIGIKLTEKKIFTNYKLLIILILGSFLSVFSWYYYAINYNNLNNDNYFLTSTTPIWELSADKIYVIIDLLTNYWKYDFYLPTTFHIFLILIVVSIIFIKKVDKLLLGLSFFLIIGGFSYFMLFFEKFMNHDYYALLFIPILLIILLNAFSALKKVLINKYVIIGVYIIFLTLNILSVKYAIYRSTKRYTETFDDNYIYQKFNGIDNKLDSLKIDNNKTFVVVGDFSRNGSLYFMNKQGWTIKDTTQIELEKLQTAFLNKPDYLVVTEPYYLQNNLIVNKSKDLIIEYNNMSFFKLN